MPSGNQDFDPPHALGSRGPPRGFFFGERRRPTHCDLGPFCCLTTHALSSLRQIAVRAEARFSSCVANMPSMTLPSENGRMMWYKVRLLVDGDNNVRFTALWAEIYS